MNTSKADERIIPQEVIASLLKLLKDMVAERRKSHDEAESLILSNLAKGTRRYGKYKLTLSKDELIAHMGAVETRRRMQRQLKVLVPVLNRVVSCSQMRSKTVEAFDKALNPMRTRLAAYACATDNQKEYEKPVADVLIAAFPALLNASPDVKPEPKAEKLKIYQSRMWLYNKITSAGILDVRDVEHLRVIFWGK